MIKIFLTKPFQNEVEKKFSSKIVNEIYKLIFTLKSNPLKDKLLFRIAQYSIKELKYKSFRFYFIQNFNKITILTIDEFKERIIKFVAMSKKGKQQQRVIEKIKKRLMDKGFDLFE